VRRLFWIAVGAGAGIYVMRKVSKVAEAASPTGIARGLESLGDSLRYFADEVRAGMSERESELREALGLADIERELTSGQPADVVSSPTSERRAR